MDDHLNRRNRLNNLKESVFSSFVDSGRKYFNSICSGSSTWDQFLGWIAEKGGKKEDNGKTSGRISEKVSKVVPHEPKNYDDAVCNWEYICCQIKMQDPCGPCCCEMYVDQQDRCPHGLLPRRKHPTCGCDPSNSHDTRQSSGCCHQCRVELEKA